MDVCDVCESHLNNLSCRRGFLSDPDNVDLSSGGSFARQLDNLKDNVDLFAFPAATQSEDLVRKEENSKVQIKESFKLCHYNSLPHWLQDNQFLRRGYRPPLNSFGACILSIFHVHTETANIWTHLLGCIIFIWTAILFHTHPSYQWEEKMVFDAFFAGAICCLGFSAAMHTFCCHSERVGKFFNKLDYCGISFLITGSFIPWLYYGFYCDYQLKIIYLTLVVVLGVSAIIVSLPDKFSGQKFRHFRAGLFMGFGLSGVVPATHYLIEEGWIRAVYQDSFGWFCVMGILYIIGGLLYVSRIPERFFPGKFDFWFHSHQIFHVLVFAGATVHYYGMTRMAMYGLSKTSCELNSPAIVIF